jgi:hypothetical protein
MSNVSLVKGPRELSSKALLRVIITVDIDRNGDIVWAIDGNTIPVVGIEMSHVALCSSVKQLPEGRGWAIEGAL